MIIYYKYISTKQNIREDNIFTTAKRSLQHHGHCSKLDRLPDKPDQLDQHDKPEQPELLINY